MRNLLVVVVVALTALLALPSAASAYLMLRLEYKDLFARADVVVIASPESSKRSSSVTLKVAQPASIRKLVVTISTRFRVHHVLKGRLRAATFDMLHLGLKHKPRTQVMVFGQVGTFFVDFDSKAQKNRSYMLFLKHTPGGNLVPAWRYMEGSRAMIAMPKNGTL